MKRFTFPLRSVTSWRAHQENLARDRFAAAVHAYVVAEEALATARSRSAVLADALRSGRFGGCAAADAASSLAAYRLEAEAEIEAERVAFAAHGEMENRRADYLAAHRKVESLNRLEDKARVAHRVEANRVEQAEFDDFAGRRAGLAGRSSR